VRRYTALRYIQEDISTEQARMLQEFVQHYPRRHRLFEFRLAPCCILKVKWKGWDSPVDAIVLPHLDLNLLGGGYVGLLGEGDGALDVDHGLSGE